MNSIDFKKLIVLWWILGAMFLPISVVSQRYLPEELLDYFDQLANKEPQVLDWVVFAIGLGLFVGVIIASIGLYRSKRWGRTLFLWVHILSLAITPAFGPSIMSEWTSAICYLYLIVTGGILFLAYAPPTSLKFD